MNAFVRISHEIELDLFIDSTNSLKESAPQPPPRRNQRENPFDRPAQSLPSRPDVHRPAPPPPPVHKNAPNTNTQGKNLNRLN